MTRYTERTFTLPASGGQLATCLEHGHAMRDRWGKCVRCGELLPPPETTDGTREIL